ncbi:unnamed protein product [Didymodactylos carnosus]|uniref:Mannosyltransferase n=1 Tax=Didymodactylos carnosus TaxID=1234261 RepID=A0A813UPH9_9BILA|nr:unnamed protein product [Didymodactylos carnosus]CAF0828895.1 unnamed protein product [Didymodactylos carnosus]CAF3536265.1 unnamed protein product [Didymodactylos carnosus]CAF3615901.1 unnamed protein product [Didymodactylos carnosus]
MVEHLRTTRNSDHSLSNEQMVINSRLIALNGRLKTIFLNYLHYNSNLRYYGICLLIRLLSTIVFPQRGYIHPDEHFQGPEIVYDDIFQGNMTRTHEFNSVNPLRSVSILYLLYWIPISILSLLSSIFQLTIPFYVKLIVPRVSIFLLSLISDCVLYRLILLCFPSLSNKEQCRVMFYYSSSYISLVYFTRTLSNSFEAFLFLFLIYSILISSSLLIDDIEIIEMDTINEENENNHDSDRNVHTLSTPTVIHSHRKFHRSMKELKLIKYSHQSLDISSVIIGIICSLGLFNRPTFAVFAFVPIMYWFIKLIPYKYCFRLFFLFTSAFVLTTLTLITFDTFYFHKKIDILNLISSFQLPLLVISPLNFFLYNKNSKNLEEHGIHPPHLHFTVNAFILFGPLHLYVVCSSIYRLTNIKKRLNQLLNRRNEQISLSINNQNENIVGDSHLISTKSNEVNKTQSLTTTRLLSSNIALPTLERQMSTLFFWFYIVPFIPLSLISHQEPRFLIPLIYPLILCCIHPLYLSFKDKRILCGTWLVFNILTFIFYGYMHQGGLIPALKYVHDSTLPTSPIFPTTTALHINDNIEEKFIITYHTYMPPTYLILPLTKDQTKKQTKLTIIDLKGSDRSVLDRTIKTIFNDDQLKNINIYLIMSATQQEKIYKKQQQQQYRFHLIKQWGPHINLDDDIQLLNKTLKINEKIKTIKNAYQCDLYHVVRDKNLKKLI